MKKVFLTSIAAVAALAALTLTSCKKEQQAANMQFTATLESPAKTAVDISTGAVSWANTDKVMIYAEGETTPAEFSVTPLSPATSARLSGSISEAGNYYAFYPKGIQTSSSSVTLPATQTYSLTEVCAPMYAQGAGPNLQFKNLCGLLVLNVKADEPIDQIRIYSQTMPVRGTFTVNCNGSTDTYTPSLTRVGDIKHELVLDIDGSVTTDPTNGTDFYIYLPPVTYPSGDLTITFHSTSGSSITKTLSGNLVIERSNYYRFPLSVLFPKTLTIDGYPIEYIPGNTWEQAINNDALQHDGWSTAGANVYYYVSEEDYYLILMDGYNDDQPVWSGALIVPEHEDLYYLEEEQ